MWCIGCRCFRHRPCRLCTGPDWEPVPELPSRPPRARRPRVSLVRTPFPRAIYRLSGADEAPADSRLVGIAVVEIAGGVDVVIVVEAAVVVVALAQAAAVVVGVAAE